jgi:hypothetical protein
MTEFEFEIKQHGMTVAGGVGGDRDQVLSMAMHYGMMYGQDGPCEVRFFIKEPGKRRRRIVLPPPSSTR